jgi:iron-sulfur cluster assembly enzyme ISCU, mitochondrial
MTTMLSVLSRSVRSVAAVRRSLPAATSIVNINKRSYHENIVEHYENPRNVGSLDKNDDNVGTVS